MIADMTVLWPGSSRPGESVDGGAVDGPLRYANGMFEDTGIVCAQTDAPGRTATFGPEFTLSVQYCAERLGVLRAHRHVAVFFEHKLEGAFPDIVIACWDPCVAASWPRARRDLTREDLKHLQWLYLTRTLALDDVAGRIGPKRAGELAARLVDAQVAKVHRRELRALPRHCVFAVERLIAIEAKIKNWRVGMQQAFRNSWFASESYLLMPQVMRDSESVAARAKSLGVGVLTWDSDLRRPIARSKRSRLPRSHASWVFNELAWRQATFVSD